MRRSKAVLIIVIGALTIMWFHQYSTCPKNIVLFSRHIEILNDHEYRRLLEKVRRNNTAAKSSEGCPFILRSAAYSLTLPLIPLDQLALELRESSRSEIVSLLKERATANWYNGWLPNPRIYWLSNCPSPFIKLPSGIELTRLTELYREFQGTSPPTLCMSDERYVMVHADVQKSLLNPAELSENLRRLRGTSKNCRYFVFEAFLDHRAKKLVNRAELEVVVPSPEAFPPVEKNLLLYLKGNRPEREKHILIPLRSDICWRGQGALVGTIGIEGWTHFVFCG